MLPWSAASGRPCGTACDKRRVPAAVSAAQANGPIPAGEAEGFPVGMGPNFLRWRIEMRIEG